MLVIRSPSPEIINTKGHQIYTESKHSLKGQKERKLRTSNEGLKYMSTSIQIPLCLRIIETSPTPLTVQWDVREPGNNPHCPEGQF